MIRRGLANKLSNKETRFGCTECEFTVHLERRFKRGMDWSNYSIYWHVGHIRQAAELYKAASLEDAQKRPAGKAANHLLTPLGVINNPKSSRGQVMYRLR
jgi:hypothetical protein